MRRFIRSSCFVVLFSMPVLSMSAWAEDVETDSKITAATVYNDRATLTRSAKVEIPAGAHNLVFTGLPLNLFADSLRVEGSSVANVTFGALSHKRESSADYVVPREKALNAQLVQLQDTNKVYQAERSALRTAKTFLENLGKQAVLRESEEIAKMELNPDTWGAAADSLSAKMSENLKSDLALGIKIREVNERIQKVQNDLRQLRTGQKQTYSVTIPFESDKPSTLNVELSYQISGVSWQPIYDARLDVKKKTLELVQYGSVWQRTGEDWEDVELTLSTAQPSRGAGLRDLYSQWLSIYSRSRAEETISIVPGGARVTSAPGTDEEVAPAYVEAVEQQNESYLDKAIATGGSAIPVPVARKASFQTAQINTEGFVGEYKITGPATVKSDGTKAKLLVGGFETENALQVQIKPQISKDAYLVVKTKLLGDAPVLPGQVSLFRDGAYIGQSHMKMLRPDDTTELAFGIDDNVTVTRNILKDERSEAGIITKDSVIEKHFVTEIQNLHKDDIKIAVLETIPASRDERIRIEILADKTTAGYETDLKNVKGVTRWMGTLTPKQKTAINLGWKVSWPKGQNISGL